MTTILILGGGGMLGHRLFQCLRGAHDVHATVRGAAAPVLRLPVYADADPARLIGGWTPPRDYLVDNVSETVARILLSHRAR